MCSRLSSSETIREGAQAPSRRTKEGKERIMKKWIITATLTDDNGEKVNIREEFNTQRDFDIRYCHLAENYDELLHVQIIEK